MTLSCTGQPLPEILRQRLRPASSLAVHERWSESLHPSVDVADSDSSPPPARTLSSSSAGAVFLCSRRALIRPPLRHFSSAEKLAVDSFFRTSQTSFSTFSRLFCDLRFAPAPFRRCRAYCVGSPLFSFLDKPGAHCAHLTCSSPFRCQSRAVSQRFSASYEHKQPSNTADPEEGQRCADSSAKRVRSACQSFRR